MEDCYGESVFKAAAAGSICQASGGSGIRPVPAHLLSGTCSRSLPFGVTGVDSGQTGHHCMTFLRQALWLLY
jgi:hypothetical protein